MKPGFFNTLLLLTLSLGSALAQAAESELQVLCKLEKPYVHAELGETVGYVAVYGKKMDQVCDQGCVNDVDFGTTQALQLLSPYKQVLNSIDLKNLTFERRYPVFGNINEFRVRTGQWYQNGGVAQISMTRQRIDDRRNNFLGTGSAQKISATCAFANEAAIRNL